MRLAFAIGDFSSTAILSSRAATTRSAAGKESRNAWESLYIFIARETNSLHTRKRQC